MRSATRVCRLFLLILMTQLYWSSESLADEPYVDCGTNCTNLALDKTVTASGLWNQFTNPASKVNDGNTGTTSACEGDTGYCSIASTLTGAQAIGNYLQVDLGSVISVKSVTVYGRRDNALPQGQNLNLKLSSDGTNWTTTYLADTTSASGYTISTAQVARYIRVETTTVVYLSLYEIVVTGLAPSPPPGTYVDCGSNCSNLAPGKTMSASGIWSANNPASKANDGNTGITSACEGASGYCAIASTSNGGQAIGNYLQVDLAAVTSVKSVTVYGRRDTALTQGQNLNLRLSADGINWTTTFMANTTSASGHTVSTAQLARYVRVETTTVAYLSLYEIAVTGLAPIPPPGTYVDCGSSCSNLAPGKTMSASGIWSANNPASKANDGNMGTTSACEGASGYCAIASGPTGAQAIGNYLQVDLGAGMSVKSVTVYGRRDTALAQGQNLNLRLSTDGLSWTTTFMADTTSTSGLTVPTAAVARYIRVETTTAVYLSLYEIVVTGTTSTMPPSPRSLVASPSTGLLTDKMGQIAASWVSLWVYNAPPPTANVSVTVTSGNFGQGLVRGPSDDFFKRGTTLVLTPSTYAIPQKVEVLGVDDGQQSGDTPFSVSLVTASSDSAYTGLGATLSVTNVDRTDHNVCISNVENQFHLLPGGATPLIGPADNIPGDEYDGNPNDEHFESVARAKHGPYLFITTKDHNNSQLLVTRFGGKAGIEGRWGANTPSANDGIVNYWQSQIDVAYDHGGGIGTFGDYLAVPLEDGDHPIVIGGFVFHVPASKVVFYDVHDPTHPIRLATEIDRGIQYGFAGASAVTRLIDGRYLVAVESNCPAEIQFYISDGTPITGSPTWTSTGVWSLYNQDDFPGCNQTFPGSEPTVQNMTFVEECGTGNLYLVLMWNTGTGGFSTGLGANNARLYQVIPDVSAGYSVAPFLWRRETRTFDCNGVCNFAAGTSLYVSPVSRQLILYGVDYYKTTAYRWVYPWTWYLQAAEF